MRARIMRLLLLVASIAVLAVAVPSTASAGVSQFCFGYIDSGWAAACNSGVSRDITGVSVKSDAGTYVCVGATFGSLWAGGSPYCGYTNGSGDYFYPFNANQSKAHCSNHSGGFRVTFNCYVYYR